MTLAAQLARHIADGVRHIGQVAVLPGLHGHAYALCHFEDAETAALTDFGGLTVHHGPDAGRDVSIYAADGDYRFTKGRTDLVRGWVVLLDNAGDLRLALDHIYPACVGLWLAEQAGTLQVENLRDKLNRQTGMYRYARTISDEGAQALVQKVCGPAHACAKKILWRIDEATPLVDSEASRYDGMPSGDPGAIPLLCREACNHFVAECRKAAKAEFEAKPS
jgi:sirohydrochlorin cobaltochelatase